MQQQAVTEFFLTSESVFFQPVFSRPARPRADARTRCERQPAETQTVPQTRTAAAESTPLRKKSQGRTEEKKTVETRKGKTKTAVGTSAGKSAVEPSISPLKVPASLELLKPAPFFAIARDDARAKGKGGKGS